LALTGREKVVGFLPDFPDFGLLLSGGRKKAAKA
jgi:hypothetical protein